MKIVILTMQLKYEYSRWAKTQTLGVLCIYCFVLNNFTSNNYIAEIKTLFMFKCCPSVVTKSLMHLFIVVLGKNTKRIEKITHFLKAIALN